MCVRAHLQIAERRRQTALYEVGKKKKEEEEEEKKAGVPSWTSLSMQHFRGDTTNCQDMTQQQRHTRGPVSSRSFTE